MRKKNIELFENKIFNSNKKLPDFRPGDTVCVHYKIKESSDSKPRIQQFEGVVIRYRKGVANSTFTIRRIGTGGIGVERVFPTYSSNISKIEIKARGVVRRSRLYYLRNLTGKSARIKSKYGNISNPQQNLTEEPTIKEDKLNTENINAESVTSSTTD